MRDRKRKATVRRRRGTMCLGRQALQTANQRRRHQVQLARRALRRACLGPQAPISLLRRRGQAPCRTLRRPALKIRPGKKVSRGPKVLPGRRMLLGRNPRSRGKLMRTREMLLGHPPGLNRKTTPPRSPHLSARPRLTPRPRRGLIRRRKLGARIRHSDKVRRFEEFQGSFGTRRMPGSRHVLRPAFPPATMAGPVLDGGVYRGGHIKGCREREEQPPER
jgi:hypothetical protein